jgi:hypothetical protein
MASSEDAFRKFAMWKKSRTVLNLTVFTNFGMPDIWLGSITSVDEQQERVEFADDATRDLRTLARSVLRSCRTVSGSHAGVGRKQNSV